MAQLELVLKQPDYKDMVLCTIQHGTSLHRLSMSDLNNVPSEELSMLAKLPVDANGQLIKDGALNAYLSLLHRACPTGGMIFMANTYFLAHLRKL